MSVYVGVDNGLDGGLVALSATPGAGIIDRIAMPTQKTGKGREVDALLVLAWLESLGTYSALCVTLETPGKHSPGLQALCSMWDSYGALRAICATRGIRHYRIAPQTWQKAMLPGCEKGQTKPFALSVARRLWPEEKWLASPRCSKPHDGMIDGALIAEFSRRNNY